MFFFVLFFLFESVVGFGFGEVLVVGKFFFYLVLLWMGLWIV